MDEDSILAILFARARRLGIDPSSDAMVQKRLGDAARKAAAELRSSATTEVNLPFLSATASGPVHLMVQLPSDVDESEGPAGPRLDPRVKLS